MGRPLASAQDRRGIAAPSAALDAAPSRTARRRRSMRCAQALGTTRSRQIGAHPQPAGRPGPRLCARSALRDATPRRTGSTRPRLECNWHRGRSGRGGAIGGERNSASRRLVGGRQPAVVSKPLVECAQSMDDSVGQRREPWLDIDGTIPAN
eukprot:6655543-Prymnesium_polylepis.2